MMDQFDHQVVILLIVYTLIAAILATITLVFLGPVAAIVVFMGYLIYQCSKSVPD